ncbi:hypothetical protein [Enterovibrio paralichthyis]|uniref:hypothetical protein n=1 Tax=Enterovibrio paralichthyis TaxID=2853805 RepID=UPI001C43A7A6|nr:hypothetical protein [Enterovibrio paralichthyis]MBV7300256.1 hypothetical protein [Enterovibrio paralichthyis]
MVDKGALLQEGRHFGRIFLSYLVNHARFTDADGRVTRHLPDELLFVGQRCGATERQHVSVNNVRQWADGSHKIPFWVNHAAMQLATENGFQVEHAADAVAIAATVIKEYVDLDLSRDLKTFSDYVLRKYHVEIGDVYTDIVRKYLCSKRYHFD